MDLTKDNIGKTLLRFSIPIVMAFLLQSVYGIGLAFPISTAVTVIVYLIPFFKGVWKESTI